MARYWTTDISNSPKVELGITKIGNSKPNIEISNVLYCFESGQQLRLGWGRLKCFGEFRLCAKYFDVHGGRKNILSYSTSNICQYYGMTEQWGAWKLFTHSQVGHEHVPRIWGGPWNGYHHRTFQITPPSAIIIDNSYCLQCKPSQGIEGIFIRKGVWVRQLEKSILSGNKWSFEEYI